MGLKSDIQKVLESYPKSSGDFATGLIGAYSKYASGLKDITGDTAIGFANKGGAITGIKAGMVEKGDAVAFSNLIETNLILFWTGVLFNLTTPPSGWVEKSTNVVIIPGVVGSCSGILGTKLATTLDNFSDAADIWVDALETFSKTVVVFMTGLMPSPSGPIPAVPPITAAIT